jgi:hypothetical protein
MASDVPHVAVADRRRLRFQFSLFAVLLCITVACIFLGAAWVESQRRLERRNLLAQQLNDLNEEIERKNKAFFNDAREAGIVGGELRDEIERRIKKAAGLEGQTRELQQLKRKANEMSVQLESMDFEAPSWVQRIQSLLNAKGQ